MSVALQSQRIIDVAEAGAVALSDEVNHLFGTKTTKLTAPSGAQFLVLIAEAKDWRVRLGDRVSSGMPSAYAVSADATTGAGALGLKEGASVTLPAPAVLTVKSFDPAAVLTYYWL